MGMKVENSLVCVWSNRIHLIFMLVAGWELASDRFASGSHILLCNAIWALTDILVYWKHHESAMLALNFVHHTFRVYLLFSCSRIWVPTTDVLVCYAFYIVQCIFLYVQHGKLYHGRAAWFRVPFKWAFALSILTRLVAYYRVFLSQYGPWHTAPFFVFDSAYFAWHFVFRAPPSPPLPSPSPSTA